MSAAIELFGISLSPWSRVCIALLLEKQIPFHHHNIIPGVELPTELLAISPLQQVPAIRHGDFHLYDSLAIAFYLDKSWPAPHFIPSETGALSKMLALSQRLRQGLGENAAIPLFREKVLFPFRGQTSSKDVISAKSQSCQQELDLLEQSLTPKQNFLLGEEPSLADMSLASLVLTLLHSRSGIELQNYPKLWQICLNNYRRPSWQSIIKNELSLLASFGVESAAHCVNFTDSF